MSKQENGPSLFGYAICLMLVSLIVIIFLKLAGPTIGDTFLSVISAEESKGFTAIEATLGFVAATLLVTFLVVLVFETLFKVFSK